MNKIIIRNIVLLWLAWVLIVIGFQALVTARFQPQCVLPAEQTAAPAAHAIRQDRAGERLQTIGGHDRAPRAAAGGGIALAAAIVPSTTDHRDEVAPTSKLRFQTTSPHSPPLHEW